MRIQHLIDGRTVEGRDYFETVNPATQEVLAEVARGGASEVQAAVAAAKAAFPKWAGTAPAERARLMRRLGDLITTDVPALSDADPPQLHAVPPGRRLRPDLALERAVHDRHLEGRALPGVRQHRGAEDE